MTYSAAAAAQRHADQQLADLPLGTALAETGSETATDQRARVLAYLERMGRIGATQDAASFTLGIPRQTLTFRFRELELAKQIQKTDRKQPTLLGRLAVVYVHRSACP